MCDSVRLLFFLLLYLKTRASWVRPDDAGGRGLEGFVQ